MVSAILVLVGINQGAGNFVQNLWSSSHTVKIVQNEKQIISEALQSPEEFSASIISIQNQNDFLLDVASQNLDQVADDQLISLIEEMPN